MKKINIKLYGVLFLIISVLAVSGLNFTASKAAMGPVGQAKNHIPVCAPGAKGEANCHARVIVDNQGKPQANVTPSGYGPAQFRGAYNLTGTTATNQTIAIVDAYDHPSILSDLNTYSRQFGIPEMKSCPVSAGTPSSPCFQKVDQRGGVSYPPKNSGWALEIALDVETAHAICENCNILLVEADTAYLSDLGAAVNQAVAMGATVISNSYGANEFSGETSYDWYYNHPGVAITASTGDSGYGVSYPAASQYVTAVGGTKLNVIKNSDGTYSYGSETAWSGAGSGCSAYEPQPAFQAVLGLTGCSKRMVADVSADADPNTGAAVYSSVRNQGRKGWFQVGGTSLSAPLVAGVYALAGGVEAGVQGNSIPYSQMNYSTNLHDILSGSNGSCGSYLCGAVSGYDGPTGLGTPNTSGAF